ncbi:hypothetical protein IQ231_01790 [Cuspidothrix issatschenkoi LEGE 03284]|uniref:hypothetical protein n=1 Tax=Cuspidothrix issatschenkoi TaxID=230752 RepID=UPI00187FC029|nr:hypothetical protein [Cuspidothrix issatschenkoi]MBE9230456.1 hypothetical protein [Cuspidothrix issatschenkoi LEGE 03284]
MTFQITPENTQNKSALLEYFRELGSEKLSEIRREGLNNNYFRTLKNSHVWNAYCGDEAYEKIGDFTHFDIQNWINSNIDWQNDLLSTTVSDLQKSNLMGYLQW